MTSKKAAALPAGSPRAPLKIPSDAATVWAVLQMEGLKLVKDPVEILSRSAQPALWLLIFGEAFDHAHAIPTGNISYLAFLAPGILAQSITFVSIFNGLAIIWEKDMGLMQKILATPIRRGALVLGKMLSASLRSFSQLGVILAMAWMLGIHFEWSLARVLGLLLMTVLGSTFFAGMSMVLAAIVRTRERMMGIGQLVTMPLFFASSALYPVSIMPPWLRLISSFNPMSYLVDALRGLLTDPSYANFPTDAGILALAAFVIWALATRQYPRLLY